MKSFDLLRYLKKWWFLIMLITAVGCLGVYEFISSRQSYTATAIIQYTNANASQGKNADGSRIDPTEITSASVINQTIQQLGLTASTESAPRSPSKRSSRRMSRPKRRRRLPMVRSMNITPLSMPFRSPWPARTPPTTPAMCWTRC
jgi:uncharacterized protein involved in exopolysaccharide biosynthesis